MSDQDQQQAADRAADETRIDQRAELLPEEKAAGSDDPDAQAAAILAESDARTQDPEGTGEDSHQTGPRTSEQASHTPTGA